MIDLEKYKIAVRKYALDSDFLDATTEVARDSNILPEHLLAIMYIESRFNPAAINPYSGATGLIQFMPTTAAELGTSTTALKSMSRMEQLTWVRKYFSRWKSKIRKGDIADAYLAVFWPAAIGKPDSYTLETKNISAAKIAAQNPIYDLNKDDKITKGEIKDKLYKIAAEIGVKKKVLITFGTFMLLISATLAGRKLYNKFRKTTNK